MDEINRIKDVLIEQKLAGECFAENLGKDIATVSRWGNNLVQPSIETLAKIAELLDVNIRELLVKSK